MSYAKKNWPENLDKYDQQEKVLSGRNSYSKTDQDATFMRMKEDHMLNGQLKPAYNWQISTQNQFILNYSLHQNPADTLTLKPHLEQYQALYGFLPSAVVADAGYASDENYQLLEQKSVAAFLKYNTFDLEDIARPSPDIRLQTVRDVPCGEYAIKARKIVIIEINHDLNRRKEIARQLLKSELGIKYRKKRPADVEPVFAQIKSNNGFRRFLTKGLSKTEVEIGLLSIAHNLKKCSA